MKNYFAITLIALASQLTHAAIPLDYDYGFCVYKGEDLYKQNAILTIEGAKVNGRRLLTPGHHFFATAYGSQILTYTDWGGTFLLQKINEHQDGRIEATYENFLHGNKVGPVEVDCIVNDLALKI